MPVSSYKYYVPRHLGRYKGMAKLPLFSHAHLASISVCNQSANLHPTTTNQLPPHDSPTPDFQLAIPIPSQAKPTLPFTHEYTTSYTQPYLTISTQHVTNPPTISIPTRTTKSDSTPPRGVVWEPDSTVLPMEDAGFRANLETHHESWWLFLRAALRWPTVSGTNLSVPPGQSARQPTFNNYTPKRVSPSYEVGPGSTASAQTHRCFVSILHMRPARPATGLPGPSQFRAEILSTRG